MMQPPASPPSEPMATDALVPATQSQQATQPASQDSKWAVDAHLWGFLIPCNPVLGRVDFFRAMPTYKVGRNNHKETGNDIVLPGMKISNFHCEISWDGREDRKSVIKVVDLSSNGTFINGEKIGKGRFAVLKEGNEIAFGTPQPQYNGGEDYRYVYRHTAAGPPTHGLYAHYDLTEELGKGSFATVMKALSKETGDFYAVKMIQYGKLKAAASHADGQDSKKSDKTRAFEREIAILESLQHPNICQLKEVFYEDATINLVLEYVPGGDLLDHIIQRDGLSEPEAQWITYQLCDALAYIHSKDIAHRDLKPENVLLTADTPPQVKVADFGLAKAVDSLTMLRTMCGTPAYLAPEVVQQNNHGGYYNVVDSWSVGVIVFSALTNATPFVNPPDSADVRIQILERTINWDILVEHGISAHGQDFIKCLLEERPEARMTLTDARDHPWLAAYNLETNGALVTVPRACAGALPAPDASMRSISDDISMDCVPHTSNALVPGAFPNSAPSDSQPQSQSQSQSRGAPLRRRRQALEEQAEAGQVIQPTSEMIRHAEEQEENYHRTRDQPNQRKLDFEASLTPMSEEEGEGDDGDNEEGREGKSEDQAMAMVVVDTLKTSPVNERPKRGRAALADSDGSGGAGPSKMPKGRGGRGRGGGGGVTRGAHRAEDVRAEAADEDDAQMEEASSGRPRRSTRLSSPQKIRKT